MMTNQPSGPGYMRGAAHNRLAAFVVMPATVAVLSISCAGDADVAPNQRGAVWGDSLVLVEELRIGGLTGDDAYTYGYVSALAPGPDGTLFVADRQIPVIRRYDAQGVHIGAVGRGGEGPDEIGTIWGVGRRMSIVR